MWQPLSVRPQAVSNLCGFIFDYETLGNPLAQRTSIQKISASATSLATCTVGSAMDSCTSCHPLHGACTAQAFCVSQILVQSGGGACHTCRARNHQQRIVEVWRRLVGRQVPKKHCRNTASRAAHGRSARTQRQQLRRITAGARDRDAHRNLELQLGVAEPIALQQPFESGVNETAQS